MVPHNPLDITAILNGLNTVLNTQTKLNTEENPFVDKGFYFEAPSKNIFVTPSLTPDEESRVGLLTPEEHMIRLDSFKPVFNYNDTFPGNHNSAPLIKEYFEFSDPYIADYGNYVRELTTISENILKMPDIKGIQVIAAYTEEQNISRTLEQFYSANNSERIAFFILENMPSGKIRDQTRLEINKFRKKFPKAIIYHIFKEFQIRTRIGLIKRMATDIAIMHYYRSGHTKNPPIILTDADCISVQKGFFTQAINKFDKNPHLDAIEVKVNQPDEFKLRIPTLWVFLRVHDFTFNTLRRKQSRIQEIRMYGRAGAIKLSSYLMVHGHCPRTRLAEDIEISWALANARHQCNTHHKYFEYNLQGIVTNPRREAETYYYNKSYFEMYNSFDDNEGVRDLDWKELLKTFPQDSRIDIPILESEINRLIDYFEMLKYNIEDVKKYIIKGCNFAGIKCEITDKARILDIAKANHNLEKLKEYHRQ